MGWRFRKSINAGGGMRINISNSGIGFSYGIPGFRQSIMPNGRTRTTYSVPGTGISYVKEQNNETKQTGNQGVYSEYDTSILGKEPAEVYKKMVSECNLWLETVYFLFGFSIIGIIGLGLGWLLFAACGSYRLLGPALLVSFVVFCVHKRLSLNQSKITLDYVLPADNAEYITILNLVKQLGKNGKLRHLYGTTSGIRARTNAGATTNLNLKNVSVSQAKPKMIKTNIKCYRLNLMKNDIYFFPDVMILTEKRKTYVVSYKDISVNYKTHDIIEHGRIAGDAEIVAYRWQYSNKDGSRDRRFSNNRKIPVCRNGQITILLPNGITIHLVGSNKAAMQNAALMMKRLCEPTPEKANTVQEEKATERKVQKSIPASTAQEVKAEIKADANMPNDVTTIDDTNLQTELSLLYTQLVDKCKNDGIVFRKAKNTDDRDAYTCVPMFVGKNYKVGANDSVMIVGRAVNGWDVEWPAETEEMVKQLLNQSFDLETINDLPNQDGYYFSRSRFFLVIKEMMRKFGANDEDWSSRFVWSNFYKVAPAIDGNPNGKVQYVQRELAIKILKKEIDILKPKYIVFVTGYDFATWSWRNNTTENTFKKEFNLQPTNDYGNYVEGYATYNSSKIVVTCRPEMKSVADWVDGVLGAFEKIS